MPSVHVGDTATTVDLATGKRSALTFEVASMIGQRFATAATHVALTAAPTIRG